ncbi:MAG TPA: flavodoxin domain-containing protein [Chloroflexota bacterium]|nr:flavodoxin domain-containing protein [Chloroflexota bacterium]
MKILVAVASRHGSTHEIANALARELGAAGHTAEVQSVEDNPTVEGYDAAVIGSAVYMGNWLPQAVQFVDRNQAQLAAMPVWLFSSGPLGADDPQPKGEPAHLDQLIGRTGARGHRTFVGKLDKDQLGFGERLIVRAVRAPDGDFRDWAAINVWADEIGERIPTKRTGQLTETNHLVAPPATLAFVAGARAYDRH